MIGIKKPIELKCLRYPIERNQAFEKKILANYDFMTADIRKEELLYLLMGTDGEGEPSGMTTLIENISIENHRDVLIQSMNQIVNRILSVQHHKLSFQDRVFISCFFRKLGIHNISDFMKNVINNIRELECREQLIQYYKGYLMGNSRLIKEEVRRIINFGGNSKEEGERAEEDIKVYPLTQQILNRLHYGEVSEFVYRFNHSYGQGGSHISHNEFLLAEEYNRGKNVRLMQLKNEVTGLPIETGEYADNPYEMIQQVTFDNRQKESGAVGMTQDRMVAELLESSLFHIIKMTEVNLAERSHIYKNYWIEAGYELCNMIDNTLERFRIYHTGEAERGGNSFIPAVVHQHMREYELWLLQKLEHFWQRDSYASNLPYQDIRKENLQYQDMNEADLQYQDIKEADLQHQDIKEADLQYPDIYETNPNHQNIDTYQKEFIRLLQLQSLSNRNGGFSRLNSFEVRDLGYDTRSQAGKDILDSYVREKEEADFLNFYSQDGKSTVYETFTEQFAEEFYQSMLESVDTGREETEKILSRILKEIQEKYIQKQKYYREQSIEETSTEQILPEKNEEKIADEYLENSKTGLYETEKSLLMEDTKNTIREMITAIGRELSEHEEFLYEVSVFKERFAKEITEKLQQKISGITQDLEKEKLKKAKEREEIEEKEAKKTEEEIAETEKTEKELNLVLKKIQDKYARKQEHYRELSMEETGILPVLKKRKESADEYYKNTDKETVELYYEDNVFNEKLAEEIREVVHQKIENVIKKKTEEEKAKGKTEIGKTGYQLKDTKAIAGEMAQAILKDMSRYDKSRYKDGIEMDKVADEFVEYYFRQLQKTSERNIKTAPYHNTRYPAAENELENNNIYIDESERKNGTEVFREFLYHIYPVEYERMSQKSDIYSRYGIDLKNLQSLPQRNRLKDKLQENQEWTHPLDTVESTDETKVMERVFENIDKKTIDYEYRSTLRNTLHNLQPSDIPQASIVYRQENREPVSENVNGHGDNVRQIRNYMERNHHTETAHVENQVIHDNRNIENNYSVEQQRIRMENVVRENIQKEMRTITEQVYQRIEKKLQGERKRRGL